MRLLRIVTVVMIGLVVQTAHSAKQSVRASKENPNDEREVTVKIMGKDQKKPISSSTFKKNTDGFVKKLHFDFSKGFEIGGIQYNQIEVEYADGSPAPKPIRVNEAASQGAEIKIGTIIFIDTQDTLRNKTIEATVKTPKGLWLVVSGKYSLKQDQVATKQEKAPGVLKAITFGDEGRQGGPLTIYKNTLTKIYAKNVTKERGKITGLSASDIRKAGDHPILIIDEQGNARITNEQLLQEKEKEKKPSDKMKQLPELVKLKALLLSKSKHDYAKKLSALFTHEQEVDLDKVNKLMVDERLSDQLVKTPYVSSLLGNGGKSFDELIGLQDIYKELFVYLVSPDQGVWQKEPRRTKNLHQAIFNLGSKK